MLYSQGISLDALGIRNRAADPRESWRIFAQNYHLFRGTPSRMWMDWVFAEAFGFDVQFSAETSDFYYDRITDALATDAFRPRALFDRFGIEVIATTESPLDTLDHHAAIRAANASGERSEEHTSELQSLMRISYAVFCLKKQKNNKHTK